MKKYILLLPALLSVNVVLAESEPYAWVLEQYQRKLADNPEDTQPIVSHTSETIDGEQYLILTANARKTGDEPVILMFRKANSGYRFTAAIAIDDTQNYSYEVKNNSFFLHWGYAHHGVYDDRYQFKCIRNEFWLIGADSQSSVLGCYSGDESKQCETYSNWDGASYNLLTSTAIYWLEKISDSEDYII